LPHFTYSIYIKNILLWQGKSPFQTNFSTKRQVPAAKSPETRPNYAIRVIRQNPSPEILKGTAALNF